MPDAVSVALFATVAIAAFIQGASGIGFAMITAPVFAFLAPELLPGCLLALMLPLNAYVAWQERGAIDRLGARWITYGRVFGAVGGAGVLLLLSAKTLAVAVGLTTLLATFLSICAPAFKPTSRAFAAAGFATGITETTTGIGGPPLALVYQHEEPATLRASIAFCFLIGELMSLALLAVTGRPIVEHLLATAALVPAVALGIALSRQVRHRVDAPALRIFVLAFSALSGAVLIVHAL
ncbi:MAG: TSUP family transporter [Lautropia sp.]